MNSHSSNTAQLEDKAKCVEGDYYQVGYGILQVIFHKPSGYINVTKLAQDGGKLFADWKRGKDN